jgi:hypothetical protein
VRNFSSFRELPVCVRKLILALGAIAAVFGGTTFGLARAQQEPATFSAYPMPGTLTASPGTSISFRGGDVKALGTVTVKGSQSGVHKGSLRAHSDGEGASFIPEKAFKAGEQVSVTTSVDIVNAAHGDFTFNVGQPTGRKNRPPEPPNVGQVAVQRYQTRRDLLPPAVSVSTNEPGHAPGLVFLAPKGGHGQDGVMIVNDEGQLVWFHPTKGRIPADFRVQTYFGKPVLTWWEGRLYGGDGDGVAKVFDSSYRQIATVHAGKGYKLDLHEFTITPRNTAIVLSYERYKRDLRPWHGRKDARIVDNVLQEIDLKTGLVLFEWHAFGNVSPADSNLPAPKENGLEWEYCHINAASLTPDGNFLVSSRNTSAVYKINRVTGKIMWRLGGKHSDFKLGPGVRFDWQHNPLVEPDGTLTVYDNSAAPATRKASRVLHIKLDEKKKTATLISAFRHPRKLLSASQGNVQTLPNGDYFVGWGSQRWFTEFSPTGKILFDGRLARGNDNYRAFRFPWTGTPATAPKVTAASANGSVTARASWNGATGVARWQLLAGPSATQLAPVADVPSAGFETAITAKTSQPYVAMRALDLAGATLATSGAVKPRAAS